MAHLAGFLPECAISTSTDHGIDADAKEAIAFAMLAYETWRRRPANLPSATGARRAGGTRQHYTLITVRSASLRRSLHGTTATASAGTCAANGWPRRIAFQS